MRKIRNFHIFDQIIPIFVAGSINQIWTASVWIIESVQKPKYFLNVSGLTSLSHLSFTWVITIPMIIAVAL